MVGSSALVIETLEFGLIIRIDIIRVCVECVCVNDMIDAFTAWGICSAPAGGK